MSKIVILSGVLVILAGNFYFNSVFYDVRQSQFWFAVVGTKNNHQINLTFCKLEKHMQKIFTKRQLQRKLSNSSNCEINGTMVDNLHLVHRYQFNVNETTLRYLGLTDHGFQKEHRCLETDLCGDLVIVSASSSNHYKETQALIENIHKTFMNKTVTFRIKFIFFDIGLTKFQSAKISRNCKCDFRIFPKEMFPTFVAIPQTYAWKPIIIQLMLKEHALVLWVDTSIRFNSSDLGPNIKRTLETGIQLRDGRGIYR